MAEDGGKASREPCSYVCTAGRRGRASSAETLSRGQVLFVEQLTLAAREQQHSGLMDQFPPGSDVSLSSRGMAHSVCGQAVTRAAPSE